ncbi:unnamed protein product, partial [marine sediment metagenome]
MTITYCDGTTHWTTFTKQTGQEMTIKQGTVTIALDASVNPAE